jgi:hypothetical protein
MIGPGAIPTLERFLADDGIEEIGRISVPACLVRMARDHPDERDTCVGVLVKQLEKFETNGPALNGFSARRGNRVDPASVLGKPSRSEHPR